MKKLFTPVIILLFLGIITSLPAYSQGLWGLDKYSFKNEYIDQIVKHMDAPNLRAVGFPQKTHGYIWEPNSWVIDTYLETAYYPNGTSHIEIYFDPGTLVPIDRSTYTYDQAGRLTEMLTESYETGSWELAMKITITYDSHGNIYEILASMWTGASWMVAFGSRSTYGYTPQNYVSSIMFQMYDFFSGWQNYENDIYTLAGNGYPTQVLTQTYNGAWIDSSRYVNIDWYEYFPQTGYGLFEYYEEELWDGSQWNPNLRETSVYDANGGWVTTRQVYTGGWVNSWRETMIINNQLPVELKDEEWIGGVWVQVNGNKFLYTFTGDNLTEEIIQNYNTGTLTYENSGKFVYSEFFYTTGQHELINGTVFKVYPNPAAEEINIQLEDASAATWHLEILNLTGQRVMSENMDFNAFTVKTISLGTLPQGIYIIRMTADDQIYTKRFLKQ